VTDWTITALKEYVDRRLGDALDHWKAVGEQLDRSSVIRDEAQGRLLDERFEAQEKALGLAMSTTAAAAAEAVASKQAMLFMTREAAAKDQTNMETKVGHLTKYLDEVRQELAENRGKSRGISLTAAVAMGVLSAVGAFAGLVALIVSLVGG
jgi:VIT1/CCC1 family predicted Fe2+/Mn2+ transporter